MSKIFAADHFKTQNWEVTTEGRELYEWDEGATSRLPLGR